MAINFVNPSRVYEASDHGVRFWGYDREIEISFLVDEAALSKIEPKTEKNRAGYILTFDDNRNRIQEVANTTYSARRKSSRPYLINLKDIDF
ncbi:MAG: DUF1488 family protein [Burkholderiaceae bacterium]